MARRKKGRNAPEIISLLKNPEFCTDANDVHEKAVQQRQATQSWEEWQRRWPEFVDRVVGPFVHKWGALPPPSVDLVDPDPRREPLFAILTGRWGVIPIFPWTTTKDIGRNASRIAKAIGKVHKDVKTRRLAQITGWLRLHLDKDEKMPPRSEIAAAVWGRKKGLRRPTKEQAIERLPEERERELIQKYKAQGLRLGEAERRVYRRARGSEAPATAAVRMAESRYRKERERFVADLESPQKADPLGYALTMLIREILPGPGDLLSIQQKAAILRDLLITPSDSE